MYATDPWHKWSDRWVIGAGWGQGRQVDTPGKKPLRTTYDSKQTQNVPVAARAI